jgi:hypothetical protein
LRVVALEEDKPLSNKVVRQRKKFRQFNEEQRFQQCMSFPIESLKEVLPSELPLEDVGYSVHSVYPIKLAQELYFQGTSHSTSQPEQWMPFEQRAILGHDVQMLTLETKNIHCVFDCRFHIDRYKLYYLLSTRYCSDFAVTFDPQKFPGVKWKSRHQSGTAFFFQQGKIVLTGVDTHDKLQQLYLSVKDILKNHYRQLILL